MNTLLNSNIEMNIEFNFFNNIIGFNPANHQCEIMISLKSLAPKKKEIK